MIRVVSSSKLELLQYHSLTLTSASSFLSESDSESGA